MLARVLRLSDVPPVERVENVDRIRLLARVLLGVILLCGATMIVLFSATGYAPSVFPTPLSRSFWVSCT
jgi:hypothetical protein